MSEDAKKQEREFQYDLTNLQVDLEFYIALAIGVLAIAYGLLSYYKDNPLGTLLTDFVVIPFAVVYLILVYRFKKQRFKDIKKKYIDSWTQELIRIKKWNKLPSIWDKAKEIIKGKPKGSKLIVLGVFLVSIGVTLIIYYPASWASTFVILGIIAFIRGLVIYEDEARIELEKKREKEKS